MVITGIRIDLTIPLSIQFAAARLDTAGGLLAQQHRAWHAVHVRAAPPLDRAPLVAVRLRAVRVRMRPTYAERVRQMAPESGDRHFRRGGHAGR